MPALARAPVVAVMFERLATPAASMRLLPLHCPWHPAGAEGWETAKWLSYGANIMSTRKAPLPNISSENFMFSG